MAQLKNILQELVISNQVGANYSDLNAAMAAGGTIKTYKVESAIVLTADITFAIGSTLIIGTQGSISGAFTLTGNNTVLIFEGINASFATNVLFAGTWLCDKVTPEIFGAIGDGIINTDGTTAGTDDQAALTNMFAFASRTKEKKITFGSKKVYYSTGTSWGVTNMVIDGNFSTLLKDDSHVLGAWGSEGIFYDLSANAYKSDSWIKCSNAVLLASLAPGDIVKIKSTEVCQPAAGEASYFGEMHMVRSVDTVNGIVYFNENLHWYYLLSDSAKVSRQTTNSVSIKNLKCWSAGDSVSATAMSFSNVFVNLENIFVKGFYYGVSIMDCWKPKVSMTAFQEDKDGVGYGLTFGGATMYGDATFLNIGCRHSFTSSGNYTNAGIVWGCRVHDSVAIPSVVVASGPFDTHASSGSVYFDNCIVYGGIPISLVNSIVDWNDTSTFSINALVRSITGHSLFKSMIENTNVNPDTPVNAGTWNGHIANSVTAFKSEGLYCYYNNCKAFNVAQAFYVYGTAMKRTSINNCEAYDCINGVYSAANAAVDELIIDGFKLYNHHYMSAGYCILLSCNYTYGLFRNIHTKNSVLLDITPNSVPTKLELTDFSSVCDTPLTVILFNHQTISQLVLTNGKIKGTGYLLYTVSDTGTPKELIMLNNITCENPTTDVIRINYPTTNIILNGVVATNPVAVNYFISIYQAVANISMSNCAYIGANATKVIYSNLAIPLGKILHNNNLFPALTTFTTGTGALAAIECIGGSLGVDRVLRGVGTPEGAITAPIGTQYLRSDGGANTSNYIKESGTGNTGWVGK